MQDTTPIEKDFLGQVTEVVEKNMSNEQFGVAELADEMNMSRSNLLRKIKKETSLSVSQLISQVRLKHAMEMLKKSSLNVSEVSHAVGFNSPSYFIKCFREYYGYPPGEVGKRESNEARVDPRPELLPTAGPGRNKKLIFIAVVTVIVAAATWIAYRGWISFKTAPSEKAIAVLPFKNDSNDSTNVYLINGLMESTLNNLQKIKALRVISRTSSEKYRSTSKTIPEMGRELNVQYFVEGSGQKMGDHIVLNIQLIDANSDRHLWAKQYRRETKDIFALQQEIAKNISEEIQAIITPEEQQRIEKKPTEDLVAYDLFLKGHDRLVKRGRKNLEESLTYFKKATELDNKFALAYADAAIACYWLDWLQAEKKYSTELANNADKAMLFDPKLSESLIAKALFYTDKKEFESAVSYLEKALEYNPNSDVVISILADYYGTTMPNTAKYIEYSLMGVRLDIASTDSVTASYMYLRLGNALIQTGFIDESLFYLDKSLAYNPQNPFSRYVRAFVMFAKTKDLKLTRTLLLEEFNKDTTRFDILQDIGKVSYYMHDYQSAYKYYTRFLRMKELRHLDVFRHENMIIGVTFAKVGLPEKSKELIADYKAWLDTDHSIYKELGLAMYYSYHGDKKQALSHLDAFTKQDNFQYWIIAFCDEDPMVATMQDSPDYKKDLKLLKDKFWEDHDKMKVTLEEKGLLPLNDH